MTSDYRRDLSVPVTEDLMVLTTLKIPAGVKLSSILVSPEPNPYGDFLRMFICLDTKVIYNGAYLSDGLNIHIEDGLADEDRVLVLSLSSLSGVELELLPYLQEAKLRVSVLGEHLQNYIVLDESIEGFDETFNSSWC